MAFGTLSASGRFVTFTTSRDGLTPDDADDASDLFLRDVVAGTTTRLRLGGGGTIANGAAEMGVSDSGRYVLFLSFAENLLPGGSSGQHLYVHDRKRGMNVQVDRGLGGEQADGLAIDGQLSADGRSDGRFVAFTSNASNLVASDGNHGPDLFLKDLRTGATTLIGTGRERRFGALVQLSADGRTIGFTTGSGSEVEEDPASYMNAFVYDRARNVTERVSIGSDGTEPNGDSRIIDISSNGRFVLFQTWATNLGAVADTNGDLDLFIRDRRRGTTHQVARARDGASPNGLTAHGSVSAAGDVLFCSRADNLVGGDTNGRDDAFFRTRLR